MLTLFELVVRMNRKEGGELNMFKYILKRIGYIIITLFLVLTVNFLLYS